jgi:co-chaperonin GroES (HSP10)
MALASSSRVIELVSASKNPKLEIIKLIGDLSSVSVKFNMVLLATYFRPEKTAGGIIRPDANKAEDEWQGKVGLVMKLGPMAYTDDDETQFQGEKVEVGEWAVYKIGDTWSLNINGYPCRMIRDSSIKMTVKDPNMVF